MSGGSSGYASFTLYRDGIITTALRLIRVLQEGQSPTADDIVNCSEALNIMVKNWQVQGLVISLMQQISFPLVANQKTYTIGPVAADFLIERPIRLFDGSFIRVDATNVDTPLEILSRQAYEQITTKSTTGVTNAIYYFPGIDVASVNTGAGILYPTASGIGWGTLYVYYPIPTTGYTLYLNVQRSVQDYLQTFDEMDLPQEWFLPLKWGLAAQIADEYEVPEDRCQRLFKTAEYYLQQLVKWQTDLANTNFAELRQQQARVNDTTENVRSAR